MINEWKYCLSFCDVEESSFFPAWCMTRKILYQLIAFLSQLTRQHKWGIRRPCTKQVLFYVPDLYGSFLQPALNK